MTDARFVVRHGRRIEVETLETGVVATRRRPRGEQYMGAPWTFWIALRKANLPWIAVVLAIYIYRRTKVIRSKTVSLVAADLKELKIDRWKRSRALRQLAAADVIRLDRQGPGRSVRVTVKLP